MTTDTSSVDTMLQMALESSAAAGAESAAVDRIVEMIDDERAAFDRLAAVGGGDAIGAHLPESDPYHVILFGWGDDNEIPYGRVLLRADGRRIIPVDHGTALVLQQRSTVCPPADRQLDRGSIIALIGVLADQALTLLRAPSRPMHLWLHLIDGGIVVSGENATMTPGALLSRTIWSPSSEPQPLRRQIADALRDAGPHTDGDGLLLRQLVRLRNHGGDCGLLRVREEHGGVWRLTYDAAVPRPDGALDTLAADDRDPHGSESIQSSPRGSSGIALAVAHLAWEAAGCPQHGCIEVVPSVGSGESMLYEVSGYALLGGEPSDDAPYVYQALRARDSAADLPACSDEIVRALHLRSTASRRAESRMRAVRAVLAQYVLGVRWEAHADTAAWVRLERERSDSGDDAWPASLTTAQRSAAGVIAALEVHGIGGPRRMSWASRLGIGRRQASDGEAWTAAIGAAAHTLTPTPDEVTAALEYIRPSDLEWAMSFALWQAFQWRFDLDIATAWAGVARAVMAAASAPDAPYTEGGAVALGQRYGVDRAQDDRS